MIVKLHHFAFPGIHHAMAYNMLLTNRICKDDVITDFEKEVKKIKEVKLYSSRQPDLPQQMETFFMVNFPSSLFKLSCLQTQK